MTPYHHGDLPRALIEAALELVRESGPKGFSLAEAARRAGVSHAAPYRHFAGKHDLIAAIAEQGFDALHAALSAVERPEDASASIVALSVEYVRWATANGAQYQVMFGTELKRPEDVGWKAAGERAFSVLIAAVTDAQAAGVLRPGDPRGIAVPIWSALHGIATLHNGGDILHVGVTEPPEALARETVSALTASPAFRPPPSGAR